MTGDIPIARMITSLNGVDGREEQHERDGEKIGGKKRMKTSTSGVEGGLRGRGRGRGQDGAKGESETGGIGTRKTPSVVDPQNRALKVQIITELR